MAFIPVAGAPPAVLPVIGGSAFNARRVGGLGGAAEAAASTPLRRRRRSAVVVASADRRPPMLTRRTTLQLVNGALGVATIGLLGRMSNSWRFLSPRGVLSTLGISTVRAREAGGDVEGEGMGRAREDCRRFLERAEERGVACPPMPAGADWLNSRPLRLDRELRGKVVLIDFWTSCCVNCQHVLPRLAELERKYGQDGSGGFVVVGAHSAKFPFERETGSVAAAVERLQVAHPVVNDERMELWNAIGISSWPSLVLVSPRGTLLSLWSGENQQRDIDLCVSVALDVYKDEVDHRPLPAAPPRSPLLRRADAASLRYPGKVLASPDGRELFVADTGNHRVLRLDAASGEVRATYGGGEPAWRDGEAGAACFHSPQGLALDGGGKLLYVADTENHAVRAIDVGSGRVKTIGGNGEQGFDYGAGKRGTAQRMSSPWDVEFDAATGMLYVAMAGIHQVWSADVSDAGGGGEGGAAAEWQVFSGTGRELEKNSGNAKSAAWAQPSHLSISAGGAGPRSMWVADSESSAVRAIELDPAGGSHATRTVAGGDGLIAENLFAFGDKDGRGSGAKFQHPLAVCDGGDGESIFCADSYNNKIKRVSRDGSVSTFVGSGKPGLADGNGTKAQFWEPGGMALSADSRTLFVADTNNYAIRRVDIASRVVTTMNIAAAGGGAVPVAAAAGAKRLVPNRRRAVFLPTPIADAQGAVDVRVALPPKCHFTEGTTSRWQANRVAAEGSAVVKLAGGELAIDKKAGVAVARLPAEVMAAALDSAAGVELETVVFYCSDSDDTCRTEADIWQLERAVGSARGVVQSLDHTVGSKRGSGGAALI